MGKTVLVLSTLDTKGEETLYLVRKLEEEGLEVVVMDLSMGGKPPARVRDALRPEQVLTPRAVLEAGASEGGRSELTDRTMDAACKMALERHETFGVRGVVGIGGSTGSLMATEVMRALPFGVPKLMVSSTAALPGLSTRYIGTGDIALFHSVVEISGVTDVLKNVLDRAACALSGMVRGKVAPPRGQQGARKALAMTMLGPCERCASAVRKALEAKGYQVTGFSAAGIGDRAMEEMIAQGFFQGVVDLAPGGVGEHHFGFMRDAGPHRLETAGRVGIPQVVSTCSVNHMTPAKSRYKPEYHERRKYDLDKYRTWIRMSPSELEVVAALFADKLNTASGPVKVVIPLGGWSSVDAPGNPTFDPAEDRLFVETLRQRLRPEVEIREVEAHMEDPAFAEAVVAACVEIF